VRPRGAAKLRKLAAVLHHLNILSFYRADDDGYYYLRTRARARSAYWARASSQEGTFDLVQYDFLNMLPHFTRADVAHYAAAAAAY